MGKKGEFVGFLLAISILGCSTRQLIGVSASTEWTPGIYPNPMVDTKACGRRGVRSWVCDPDGLLSYNSANVVEGTLKEIAAAEDPFVSAGCKKRAPGDPKGFQVAVALMSKIAVGEGETIPAAAKRFTEDLFERWGVGSKDCGNGVLMLLSKDDRQVHITTGSAGHEDLDEGRVHSVIAAIRPKLQKGDYDGAVEQAVVDIGLCLAGGEIPDADGDSGADWPLILFGASFAGIFGFAMWSNYKKRHAQQKCRNLLEKLRKEQATALATSQYPATSCPICLEDLVLAGDESCQETPSAPPAPPDLAPGPAPGDDPRGGRPEAAPLLRQRSSSKTRMEAGDDTAAPEHAGTSKGRNLRPLVLPCGHTFCEECISTWLDKNNSCPICRVPLVADPPAGATTSQGALHQQVRQQPQNLGMRRMWEPSMYQSEFMFRLGSLHRMYPYIITLDMLSFWQDQITHGCVVDWPSERFFQLNDSALRADRASAGQWGASSGFGGGSSAGGTSAGGGW